MNRYAQLALEEYNSDTKTVRRAGINGKPFWNVNASQFMFVPQLLFPEVPGALEYVYTARDSRGGVYSFHANNPIAALTPIWKDIAPGYVEITVEGINFNTGKKYLSGTRLIFKTAPFPGREELPERARSYREAALLGLRYVFNDPTTRYWLEHGIPDPEYAHNAYPAKMIASIVKAMLAYASIEPEHADEAKQLAINAADYLLSITYDESSKLAGLPPTYCLSGLNMDKVRKEVPAAINREQCVMMIYPAASGLMYLKLYETLGEERYLAAAKRIAAYYRANLLPEGSWYLLVNEKTGEPESTNLCADFTILDFFVALYKCTGESCWKELTDGYYKYLLDNCYEPYNWEGQFEDSIMSVNYHNLTHILPAQMIAHITANHAQEPEMVETAEEILRFIEDQFVVWGEHADWNLRYKEGDYWYSPAGLEQYKWYVPIDASTVTILSAFLDVYALNHDPLLLEKACALGDSVTRLQDPESGVIPTHWMSADCTKTLSNFWINCHIHSSLRLLKLAEVVGE